MAITFSAIEPDIASLIRLAIEVSDIVLNGDQIQVANSLQTIENLQTIAKRLKDMMQELDSMHDNKLDRGTKRVMTLIDKNGG